MRKPMQQGNKKMLSIRRSVLLLVRWFVVAVGPAGMWVAGMWPVRASAQTVDDEVSSLSARLDSASGELGDDCHEERDGSRGHLDSLREAAAEMNRPASAAEAEDRIADFERVRAVARESIDNYVSCAMKIRSERRILVAVIAVVLTMGAVAIYWLRRRRRGSKEGIR